MEMLKSEDADASDFEKFIGTMVMVTKCDDGCCPEGRMYKLDRVDTNPRTAWPFLVDVDGELNWVNEISAPLDVPDWKLEQMKRMGREYAPIPDSVLDWFTRNNITLIEDHFLHMSYTQPGLIAFTENEDKGVRDIQTPLKFGRYLHRFYPERLSSSDIKEVVELFNSEVITINFATTQEDIAWVYQNGPDSCMSHPTHHFNTDGTHPTEVYGAGDLAIAWYGNKDGASARALCWPERKIYGGVYGNDSIIHALKSLGYSRYDETDEGFDGARILKIKNDNDKYIVPYIDGDYCYLREDDDYFYMSEDGPHSTQCSHDMGGLLRIMQLCPECGDRFQEEEIITFGVDGEEVESCRYCRDRLYVKAIVETTPRDDLSEDNRVWKLKEDCVRVDGNWWHSSVSLSDYGYINFEGKWLTEDQVERKKLESRRVKANSNCRIRSTPSRDSRVIGTLKKGESAFPYKQEYQFCEPLEQQDVKWLKINKDGVVGWVLKNRVSEISHSILNHYYTDEFSDWIGEQLQREFWGNRDNNTISISIPAGVAGESVDFSGIFQINPELEDAS